MCKYLTFLSKEKEVLLLSTGASKYPTTPSSVLLKSQKRAPAAWASEYRARAYKAHKKKPAATLSAGSILMDPVAMASSFRTCSTLSGGLWRVFLLSRYSFEDRPRTLGLKTSSPTCKLTVYLAKARLLKKLLAKVGASCEA